MFCLLCFVSTITDTWPPLIFLRLLKEALQRVCFNPPSLFVLCSTPQEREKNRPCLKNGLSTATCEASGPVEVPGECRLFNCFFEARWLHTGRRYIGKRARRHHTVLQGDGGFSCRSNSLFMGVRKLLHGTAALSGALWLF